MSAGRTSWFYCQGADIDGRPMTPEDDPEHPGFRRCPEQLSMRVHSATPQRAAIRAHAEASGWGWSPAHEDFDVLWCPRHDLDGDR